MLKTPPSQIMLCCFHFLHEYGLCSIMQFFQLQVASDIYLHEEDEVSKEKFFFIHICMNEKQG